MGSKFGKTLYSENAIGFLDITFKECSKNIMALYTHSATYKGAYCIKDTIDP